jgi:putative transposase
VATPTLGTYLIRDEADFAQHCDYIHYNPVHHYLCQVSKAWQFSSVHRFIAQGIYPSNWGDQPISLGLDASQYES